MRSQSATPPTPVPSLAEAAAYFGRLLLLVRPYWGGLGKGLLLGLIAAAVGLAPPYFAKLYFDQVYPARDYSLLSLLVIGAAAFTLASALMGALRTYYSQVVTTKLGSAVGLLYFNHLQHLPIRFFDQHRVGEVMSRLGDVRSALGSVSRVIQTILVNSVYLLLVPPFLILLSWKLSVVAIVTTPATIGLTALTSRIVRRYLKEAAEANAELGAIQVEAFSQIRTLKTLAIEHHFFRQASDQTADVLRAQLRSGAISSLVSLANAGLRATGVAALTWYSWRLILNGEITLGTYAAFSAYLGYLTGPVSQLAGLFADFQQISVTLARAFEYLDLQPEQSVALAYSRPTRAPMQSPGPIALDRVSFGYSPDRPVLREISLTIEPGKVTAFVGSSGAGKSTLLRLLCRMERPTSGSIRFSGLAAEDIPLSDYRRQFAVVWQEPTLFRGTLWENLTLDLDSIDRAKADEAMVTCQLDNLVRELPSGYDTPIAEWGASLSGGQRQRVAIARALLRDTSFLIFDEATSQVDVRTEEALLRQLLPKLRDRTIVLVTHRIATASLADRICVLEAGRVVADGSHDELSERSSSYQAMVAAAHTNDDQRRVRLLGAV